MYPSCNLIYHSIPSYDGICEYMSGYQVGRIPDGTPGPNFQLVQVQVGPPAGPGVYLKKHS